MAIDSENWQTEETGQSDKKTKVDTFEHHAHAVLAFVDGKGKKTGRKDKMMQKDPMPIKREG